MLKCYWQLQLALGGGAASWRGRDGLCRCYSQGHKRRRRIRGLVQTDATKIASGWIRRQHSAPRPGGLLQPAEAVLDLLLVLRLGQFPLSDLNQLGRDCGLEEALDEAHEFSKVKVGRCTMTGGDWRAARQSAVLRR